MDAGMHIIQPPQAVNGIPPENFFLVMDSANMPIANGFIDPSYRPSLFPERPICLYTSLRSNGPGLDLLLGAILARAYQLRKQYPQYKARLFAQVNALDAPMMSFYMDSGFQDIDQLDIVDINPPNAKPTAPMGFDMSFVPLSTPAELRAFLLRMNAHRLVALQYELMTRFMSLPHFVALYIARGQDIAGEIILTGEGEAASLIGLYVMPSYRRKGIGKSLIAAGMKYLSDHGVTRFQSDVIRHNAAQYGLAQICNATYVRTACFFPGINYD